MKLQYFFLLLVTVIAGSLSASYSQTSSAGVKGNWAGTLSIGPNQLRLVLKIVEQPDNQLKAALDSLDQPNANDLTVDVISFQNNTLHFDSIKRLPFTILQ